MAAVPPTTVEKSIEKAVILPTPAQVIFYRRQPAPDGRSSWPEGGSRKAKGKRVPNHLAPSDFRLYAAATSGRRCDLPPIPIEIAEGKKYVAVSLLQLVQLRDPGRASQFAVRCRNRSGRGQRQREPVRTREIGAPAGRQHDDVPRGLRVLDVGGDPAAADDFEAQHFAVEAAACVLVVAFQRSMRQCLRDIAAPGEPLLG